MNEHNRALFDAMQRQLTPSPAARAALARRLAQRTPPRRTRPLWACAAAACAVLAMAAVPLNGVLHPAPPLHSYVRDGGLSTADTAGSWDMGGADRPESAGAGPSVNTGDQDAPVLDLPAQEEALDAYQRLMAHFAAEYGADNYPDWYGGAYLDNEGGQGLVVLLVEDQDPGDKTLELQVLAWTDGGPISFGSAKYSLSHLRDLQRQAVDSMWELGLFAGCGILEDANCLELTLTGVTDEALARLAALDPEDDAILVRVGRTADLAADTVQPVVQPAQPGGVPDGTGRDPIAIEPENPAEDASGARAIYGLPE